MFMIWQICNNFFGKMPQHKTGLFYEPLHEKHRYKDDSQPDRPERVSYIWHNLVEKGLDKQCVRIKNGREATVEELELVHEKNLIEDLGEIPQANSDQLLKIAEKFKSKWSLETYHEIYLNNDSWTVTKLATGGLLQTIDEICAGNIDNAFAIVRPPGHHASAEKSAGFCIINNVAVGAKYALEKGLAKKVLIVDWDVHHGNGTQNILYNDNHVLYVSTHRHEEDLTHYPGVPISGYTFCGEGDGLGFNVNIPFEANLPLILDEKMLPLRRQEFGDNEMLYVFHKIILPIAHEYQPDLVLVSSGFDASDGDPVGDCSIHPETYGHMTSHLLSLANGKVCIVMEGGYNWESNAKCGETVTRALLSTETPTVPDLNETNIYSGFLPTVKKIIKIQSQYWKCLHQ